MSIKITSDDAPLLIIPVEIQVRELISRIILSAFAVNRGYRVILGKDRVVRRHAPYLPKGVILDKGLGLPRHGKPQRLKKLGHIVTAIDEEGTGFYGSPDQFMALQLADETLAAAGKWFCISDKMYQAAKNEYPHHAHKFVTTGMLRTDAWRNEFREFYQDEVNAIKNKQGPYILFCSNFGRIIHGRGDKFVSKQIKGQRSSFKEIEKHNEQIKKQGAENLEKFLEVIPKINQWYPDRKIIIRPHPAESVKFWKTQFRDNEHIEVISNGVATNWILGSDCLFHHGCTTGVEAEIMGKAHVMYAPKDDAHHDTELMKAFAPIAKTENQLRKLMDERLRGSSYKKQSMKNKEVFFSSLSGKLATQKILDELDKLAFKGCGVNRYFSLTRFFPRMLAADFKPQSKKAKAYSDQKWQGISKQELVEQLNIAAKNIDQELEFKVNELVPDLYEIITV